MPFDRSQVLSFFSLWWQFNTWTPGGLTLLPRQSRKPIIARRDRPRPFFTLFRGEQPQPPWRLSKSWFSFHRRHLCMLQEVTIYPMALIRVSFGCSHEKYKKRFFNGMKFFFNSTPISGTFANRKRIESRCHRKRTAQFRARMIRPSILSP